MLCCGWCWPGFPGAGCWSRWPLASSCSGGPGPRDAKSMRVWRSRPTSSGSMSRYRPRRVSTGSLRSFSGVWWSQSTWESRYRHCADAGVLLFAVVVLAAGGDVVLEAAQPVPVLAEPLHEVADGARLLAAVRRAGPGWVSRAVGWAACAWALAPCCCSLRFRGLARPQHAPVGPQRPGFGVFARLGSPQTRLEAKQGPLAASLARGGSLPPVARGVGAIRRAAMTVDAPPRRIASAAARKCTPHARLSGRERDRNATRVENLVRGRKTPGNGVLGPPSGALSIL